MPALLVLAFLVVPIAEIYVIIQVGQAIGGWQTLVLLVLESMLGAWIVRREGARAWRALRQALSGGGLPSRELLDAALVLVGGTLMLAPGFLTDAAGILLVLPLTRPLARRLVSFVLLRRLARAGAPGLIGGLLLGRAAGGQRTVRAPRADPPRTSGGSHPVVPGEVVRDPDDPR